MIETHQTCLNSLFQNSMPDGERCIPFRVIEDETGLPRAEVRRACRALARKGLAQYFRGLWSEEEDRPAGAGYCISKAGQTLAAWPDK